MRVCDPLGDRKFEDVTPQLRQVLLDYFQDRPEPEDLVERKVDWEKMDREAMQLKTFTPRM